ncbi:alpha/beta fold hydrolase [Metaclostridioides mangenotii]|uniref:alpha/beta fold hydrolase n=1 Tax=Metaclostridioides mangenotii TaxID=1540 RepID=UPI000465EC9F|nr:alpha/beta hydrolase [Clostridioides mangenotii]
MKYYIRVEDNVRIFAEDLNPTASKTLFFIHGWPQNHKVFEYQINRLINLGFRCVAIDLRGFGNSDSPTDGYDYNRMADDIKVVIDTLKLNNITIIGHSMGGAIAIRYMARHRNYGVSKLILIGAASPKWTQGENWNYGFSVDQVDDMINQLYNDRPKLIRIFSEMFFYQYISTPLADWFSAISLSSNSWATIKCLESLRDEEEFDDLPKIYVPTLILHGTHDQICPFELAEYMNKSIQRSRLIPLTESGHGSFYEQRDTVTQQIADFANENIITPRFV